MESTGVLTKSNTKINYKVNFLILVLGRLVSNLGGSVFGFAMSLYVLDITGSAGAFSMILSFSILPGVFVNIFASVLVDKYDKKKIIVGMDILCGLFVLLYMIIFKVYPTNMLLLTLYVITMSSMQAFFGLAINASVPNIVSEENVATANSTFQGVGAGVNIIGPIIGAVAYAAIGIENIFLVNGIALILSGISEMFLKFSRSTSNVEVNEKKGYFEDFKIAYSYLNSQKILIF